MKKKNIPEGCKEFFLPVEGKFQDCLFARGIYSGGVSYRSKDFVYSIYKPKDHNLVLTLSGSGEVIMEDNEYYLKQDDLFLVPAGFSNYKQTKSDEWKAVWLWINPREEWDFINKDIPLLKKCGRTRQIRQCVEMIITEGNKNIPSANLMNHLIDLLCVLVKEELKVENTNSYISARLDKLWDLVRRDLTKKWTLKEMAKIAGFSPRHFSRLNYECIGSSPIQHLIFLRMNKAKEYLSSTDYPISYISRQLGYSFEGDFCAAFKKNVKSTPKQYRESN